MLLWMMAVAMMPVVAHDHNHVHDESCNHDHDEHQHDNAPKKRKPAVEEGHADHNDHSDHVHDESCTHDHMVIMIMVLLLLKRRNQPAAAATIIHTAIRIRTVTVTNVLLPNSLLSCEP